MQQHQQYTKTGTDSVTRMMEKMRCTIGEDLEAGMRGVLSTPTGAPYAQFQPDDTARLSPMLMQKDVYSGIEKAYKATGYKTLPAYDASVFVTVESYYHIIKHMAGRHFICEEIEPQLYIMFYLSGYYIFMNRWQSREKSLYPATTFTTHSIKELIGGIREQLGDSERGRRFEEVTTDYVDNLITWCERDESRPLFRKLYDVTGSMEAARVGKRLRTALTALLDKYAKVAKNIDNIQLATAEIQNGDVPHIFKDCVKFVGEYVANGNAAATKKASSTVQMEPPRKKYIISKNWRGARGTFIIDTITAARKDGKFLELFDDDDTTEGAWEDLVSATGADYEAKRPADQPSWDQLPMSRQIEMLAQQ